VSAESVALLLQFGAQYSEIVNLAIKHQRKAPVCGDHGLVAGLAQVNDCQSLERQSGP
jgi:hypothetical protein